MPAVWSADCDSCRWACVAGSEQLDEGACPLCRLPAAVGSALLASLGVSSLIYPEPVAVWVHTHAKLELCELLLGNRNRGAAGSWQALGVATKG